MKKTDGVWSARLFTGQPMRLTIQPHDGWEIAGWKTIVRRAQIGCSR